jgi:hypothetical protein
LHCAQVASALSGTLLPLLAVAFSLAQRTLRIASLF